MTVQECLREIRLAAAELATIDLGYPLGHNAVLPAPAVSVVDSVLREVRLAHLSSLQEFYYACNGLSFPDVHVGYFIKPIARLADDKPESEPTAIKGPFAGEVVTIGSTGGGGLFAVERASNAILHLPLGPLHSGIYDASATTVVRVSQDFGAFLVLLLGDIIAFVRGDVNHQFIAS